MRILRMLAEDEVTDEYVITETDYATNPYKLEQSFYLSYSSFYNFF